MSKIVIDAREWPTSTGRYISNLVPYLEQLDHDNEYTVLLYPKDFDKYQPKAANFHKLATPYKEFTFAEQLGYKKQLDSLQADLVHFGMVQQPVLYRGKTVTTMHDLTAMRFKNPSKNPVVFAIKQAVYKWVNKRVAHKTDALITPTEFVKQDVVKYTGVSPDKITVTLESADLIPDDPQPVEGLAGKQFIMYVGRPQPHKNLERLIDAFAQLQKQHPELMLALAGKKDLLYEQHERYANNKQIANIVFTDFISDAQLKWLYQTCAAYIVPSLSEGFGLPGVEAMLHGAPVVSSNATCLPEVYGEAALYFDPLSTEDMVAKIGDVLNDKGLAARLRQAGTERAKSFSWQRMAEQTLAVYKQVLGQ